MSVDKDLPAEKTRRWPAVAHVPPRRTGALNGRRAG